MYQEYSIRVTKVTDYKGYLNSVMRWKVQANLCKKCCKQHTKKALSGYNLIPKVIIIFLYDDKQIILLTSMRNDNP